MSSPSPGVDALEGALSRASARVDQAVSALGRERRIDLAGLPHSAATWVLARHLEADARPLVVVTADTDAARRAVGDLELFAGLADTDDAPAEGPVLFYPGFEVSPFVDVAPDRRAAMDRLATLFHLGAGLPWRALVVPLSALGRRVPPRDAVVSRSAIIRSEEEVDREALIELLVEGGYLRVPVVEDPGTFAVRGALLDVFPPHSSLPVRIELDDWLVLSLRPFDPDDQRTLEPVSEIAIHPVRDAIQGEAERGRARVAVRELCDAHDVPTRAARALVEDLESGRLQLGVDAFLPAFYEGLESLFEALPEDALFAVLDPLQCAADARDVLDRAERDHGAKRSAGAPVFPFDAHYLDEAAIVAALEERRLACVHRIVIGGTSRDVSGTFDALEPRDGDAVLHLAIDDHAALAAELSARRSVAGREDALSPLATRAQRWLDSGSRVIFTARTGTQANRLKSLLAGYELPVTKGAPPPLSPEHLRGRSTGAVEITIGNLSAGFTVPTEALAIVTEEEVFGTRSRRRKRRGPAERKTKHRAFLEDLRQLQPGDYVVHSDHGIGRYIGLERKRLGVSKDEELRGVVAAEVEVLVVEYTRGDRLFLPVTRLHQLEKYSGKEGHAPKLDRLGGQSFAKTKAKVRKQVRQMADELLKLYAERLARKRPALPPPDRAYAELEATFPFDETADQARAIEEVLSDLEGDSPMDRIVCGDVGFGKTEVAMRAAFRVAMSGRQVAVLCPTTVLAQQHFHTFVDRLSNYPLRIEALSRFVDKKRQAEILAATKDRKVDILVGTHRLLSKDVHFANLGLLVVDEEQRFGVVHKERIKKLRAEVDVLTLTATPIPRTLQLAVGGLRDLSLITTPPTDRRAVRTLVTRWDDHLLKEAVERELARGGQTFFVYNRVEGLYERAAKLQQLIPQARIAVAHGQLSEALLERTMTDFVDGAYDVLCATAIIESGLDIPRANTIIIDRADLFGLAQLYQLRGRVGRSKERAYCYLLTPPPTQLTDDARARIEALERLSHLGAGFSVASLDMELRGAGDVLGAEQSGTVAAVGFDLFLRMLEEAMAEVDGQSVVHDVDPELSVDVEHYLPDDYIEDVGLRLSFYKRLASADDEQEVVDLASEMEDRFGRAPRAAETLVRLMRLKPALRELKALGCEASGRRVALHLREDTPLDPAKVMRAVAQPASPYSLTRDMKLIRRFDADSHEASDDPLANVEALLNELDTMRRDEASAPHP